MLKDQATVQNTPQVGPHADPDDIRSYIDAFLLEQKVRRNSPNTIRYYRENLGRFVQFLEGEGYPTNVYQIKPVHIRHFFVFLSESTHRWNSTVPSANRKLSPGGVHGFARSVRALIHFVTTEANLPRNPMTNVSMPSGRTQWQVQVFSDEEIVRLFACIEQISRTDFVRLRNRAMLATLLDSGLRAAELLSMTVNTEWQEGLFEITGKGEKTRKVAIGSFAIRELSLYARARQRVRASTDALFLTRTGEAARYWTLREFFRDMREVSGIEHCHPHACRATALSKMLKAGMPLVFLKQVAGHASLVTTERFYLSIAPEDVKGEHEKYGPLDLLTSKLKRAGTGVSGEGASRAAVSLPPATELLRQLREGRSYRELGRQYGCSDVTIRNRLKSAGLLAVAGKG